jgi:hypothetical protein
VADDRNGRRRFGILFGQESSPQRGFDAENREEVGRDQPAAEISGWLSWIACEREVARLVRHESGERFRPCAEIEEIRIGHFAEWRVPGCGEHPDELAGSRHVGRTQGRGIRQAEHRRIRADPERQRNHGGYREVRRIPERAKRDLQILENAVTHQSTTHC